MNHETDHDNLLNDVLAEASPAGFRDTMLDETLRLAGQRRRWRNARRASGVLAVISIIAAVLLQQSPRTTVKLPPGTSAESYILVQTQPLPAFASVRTQPLAAEHLISSTTTAGSVAMITSHDAVRIINDDELLALVASRPAMLVRLAPGREQLVFVNPEDEKGFPLN